MKSLIATLCLVFSCISQANVSALFHPHDPTIENIGQWLREAQSTVDIALYNMDVTDDSPVINILKSEDIQNRIKTQDLKIRLIFEGYGTKSENAAKIQPLVENLTKLLNTNQPSPCSITPMALNVSEISQLLKLSPSCQKRPTPVGDGAE